MPRAPPAAPGLWRRRHPSGFPSLRLYSAAGPEGRAAAGTGV